MIDTQAKDSMVLMVGRAIVLVVSVITPMILVRLFSLGEYGEYRQAMLIITTAGNILSLGMPNSLYYFLPHFPEQKGEYLSRTILIMSAVGGLFCLAMWLGSGEVARFFNNPKYHHSSLLIGITTFVFTFSFLIDTALLADGEVMLSTKIMTWARIVQAPVLIFCAATGGVDRLISAYFLTLALKSALSVWFFRRRYRISFRNLAGDLGPHLQYAVPLGMGALFSLMSESADKFIVSHYLGEKLFAIYSTGCYELPFIIVIFGSIGDVVLPIIVRLKSEEKTREVVRAWHRAIEQSMLIGIPIFIFFFAYAEEFITTIFTVKYAAAVPIFRLSIVTILLESSRYGLITRAYARTGFMFFVSMAAFLLMLPATVYGIRYFGMIGAIAAFVATRSLIVGSEIAYSKFILELRWRDLLPFWYMAKIAGLSLLCLVVPVTTARWVVFTNNWLELFYLMGFTFASYVYVTNYTGYWAADTLPIPEWIRKRVEALFPGRQNRSWISA